MNACEESKYSFQPENQETSHSGDNKQKRLASILATAQKDSSTRLFLKDETLKQVDGDYNFIQKPYISLFQIKTLNHQKKTLLVRF